MDVILHCDDAGWGGAITERLLAAWSDGVLDSFSVLPNGDRLASVAAALESDPEHRARLAVHLNLSEGSPCAPASDVPVLLNGSGRLSCSFGGLLAKWYLSGRATRHRLAEQVEREWSAQIAAVQQACRPRAVTAVDSHRHLHMLPFLFPIAARLAAAHGIPEIRISREVFHVSPRMLDVVSPAFPVNLMKHVVLRGLSGRARRVAAHERLGSPDVLIGLLYSGRMTSRSAVAGLRAAARAGAERLEVVFHAGRGTPADEAAWPGTPSAGRFRVSPERDAEYRELVELRRALPKVLEPAGGA
jgi:predicted glycoside hydrolase/deacetylase ChbG (UPF0249 family)